MRKTILTLVLALTAVSACSSPMARAPENGGTACYVLAQVDGRPLPYLQGEGSSIAGSELSEGMLQLRPDGTFFLDVTYFVNSAAGPRRSGFFYEGMWTRVGEYIDFEFENGATDRAEIVDGAILLEVNGLSFRWEQ